MTLTLKCDSVPLRTHVCTGELGRFWLSYVGFFVLLFPNMFNLFGFLMLWFWACLMKVIPETRHAHLIIYQVFIINYSYRAWTNSIYCNWCWFWCSINTDGSFICNMSKVCKYIIYIWCLTHYLQLFLYDNIPNNNKIRPIKILSMHCSRYLAYPFASQIRCTTIYKTNDQVDLKTYTRKLNTWKSWTETKCHKCGLL